jgi:hypothetical protein
MQTITLPVYASARNKETGTFEVIMNTDEVHSYCDKSTHIWAVTLCGDARQVKVNGAVRRWKRDRTRIEIPYKYGLYEYGTFDAHDITNGRILRRLS